MAEKLTYGQRSVGLKFNPSGDDAVAESKQAFAGEIDRVHELAPVDDLHGELIADAERLIRAAQMAVTKALTWKAEDDDASS